MKTPAKRKPRLPALDARSADMLASLRDARKAAVRSAKMHRVPVVFLRNGTLVRERA